MSLLTPFNGSTDAKSICKDRDGNIYTAGTFDGQPVYWFNGEMYILPCTSGIYGKANSIFVVGSDVYVAGYMNINVNGQFTNHSTLWKNGVPTQLSIDQSDANSVFVYGNDVYVCGYENEKPVIWKNNIMSFLNTSATNQCVAKDIEVINGDVYVCGYGRKIYTNGADPEELHFKARYWKNGVETKLYDDNTRSNYANSLEVVGNTIYVAGSDIIHNANYNGGGINVMRAKYWKNNVANYLTDGVSTRAEALSISVDGNTVFTSGWSNPRMDLSKTEAVIWENTLMTNLTNFSTGNSVANSIYIEPVINN